MMVKMGTMGAMGGMGAMATTGTTGAMGAGGAVDAVTGRAGVLAIAAVVAVAALIARAGEPPVPEYLTPEERERAADPVLECAPASVTIQVVQGETAAASLRIRNAGGRTLNWRVTLSPDWLFISSRSGALGHREAVEVTLVVRPERLVTASATGDVVIEAPGAKQGAAAVSVKVAGEAPPPREATKPPAAMTREVAAAMRRRGGRGGADQGSAAETSRLDREREVLQRYREELAAQAAARAERERIAQERRKFLDECWAANPDHTSQGVWLLPHIMIMYASGGESLQYRFARGYAPRRRFDIHFTISHNERHTASDWKAYLYLLGASWTAYVPRSLANLNRPSWYSGLGLNAGYASVEYEYAAWTGVWHYDHGYFSGGFVMGDAFAGYQYHFLRLQVGVRGALPDPVAEGTNGVSDLSGLYAAAWLGWEW